MVGKFAPLHRGHQILLDEAARACEQLIILSYSHPEFPGCGPAQRERWLRTLYPEATIFVLDDTRLAEWCDAGGVPRVALPPNDALDDVHRRFVGWLLQAMVSIEIDAVFTSEAYGDGLVQVLNDLQTAPTQISHVEVDRARSQVPISGTVIRRNIHANQQFLHPYVYSDFVERVAILGGESTGKTTLAHALSQRLGTAWVPEYGRELWFEQEGRLVFPDMLRIACEQVRREEAARATAIRLIFCDTTPLTTMLYSEEMFGRVDSELVDLADRPYDHTFLCEVDFTFVQDGTRRDEAFRASQNRWYIRELRRRGIGFQVLSGSLEARIEHVLSAIGLVNGGAQ